MESTQIDTQTHTQTDRSTQTDRQKYTNRQTKAHRHTNQDRARCNYPTGSNAVSRVQYTYLESQCNTTRKGCYIIH